MINLKSRAIQSIRRGINISIFGMEASGHNTLGEEILKSLRNCYISVLDSRLFSAFSESLVKRYLYAGLKSLNPGIKLDRFKNLDDFFYFPNENRKLVILFKNTEIALKKHPEMFKFLRGMSRLCRGSIVFIFTGNHHALRPESIDIPDSEIFLGNILVNLPYGLKKSLRIFKFYSFKKKWLDRELTDGLINLSGGNPNIVQGLARYLNSCKTRPFDLSPGSLIKKSEIRVRLNQIYRSFNKRELALLRKVVGEGTDRFKNEQLELLKKIGIINPNGGVFSGLFEEFLSEMLLRSVPKIKVVYGKVFVESKEIDDLTKKEVLLLQLLLRNEGRILNRDEIFEAIWNGNLEKYSDWNLDQLVRRLRIKLRRYNLENNFLTVKRRGFMWYFD